MSTVIGGKGSTTTVVADERLVTGEGSLGLTGEGNTLAFSSNESFTDASVLNYTSLDGGAIQSAADVVRASLGAVENSNVIAGEGFGKVLDLAGNLFTAEFASLNSGRDDLSNARSQVASAYQTAKELTGSALDQKTIVLLAAAALIALYFLNRRRA